MRKRGVNSLSSDRTDERERLVRICRRFRISREERMIGLVWVGVTFGPIIVHCLSTIVGNDHILIGRSA